MRHVLTFIVLLLLFWITVIGGEWNGLNVAMVLFFTTPWAVPIIAYVQCADAFAARARFPLSIAMYALQVIIGFGFLVLYLHQNGKLRSPVDLQQILSFPAFPPAIVVVIAMFIIRLGILLKQSDIPLPPGSDQQHL